MKISNKKIQEKFLGFYDTSQRVLPWRDNKNPYYIWVSEIMLQQTRVETVISYFNRFIEELPTVSDLATCDEDKLMKLWEGLGYYSRVRNLQKAAKIIVNEYDSKLPNSKKELESLPGIGPYTSGAVLSIAYENKVPAVDGNVLRVFSRLYKIEEDIKDKRTKQKIKEIVESVMPNKRIGDFNQSIMELGATICIPNGAPLCNKCPFEKDCLAKKNKVENLLPFKTKKTKRKVEKKTVVILQYQDKIAIKKRPPKGLLASLYEFNVLSEHVPVEELEKLYLATPHIIGEAKHIFTHKEWNIKGYHIFVDHMSDEYIWVTKEELFNNYSIPSAYKKYKDYIGTI